MLYPVYIQHDPDSAWSGEFPDFPGCFVAADELQEIPAAAQEAVEAHYGYDHDPIPPASALEQWLNHPDFQGGFWLLAEIDLSRIDAHRAPEYQVA